MDGRAREFIRAVLWSIPGGVLVTVVTLLAGQTNPYGLLLAFLVGSVAVAVAFELIQRPQIARRLRGIVDALPFSVVSPIRRKRAPARRPPSELGFLDFEKKHLTATGAATKTLEAIGREMLAHSPKVVAAGAEMAKYKGAPVDQRLKVTGRGAQVIASHAVRLERLERAYRRDVAAMTEGLVQMLRLTPSTTDLGQFPTVIANTARHTADSKKSMVAYRDSVAETRALRVSQKVNDATDHLIAVLNLMLEDTDSVLRSYQEARRVIAQRWPKR